MYMIMTIILLFILLSLLFNKSKEHYQDPFAGLDSVNRNVYYDMDNYYPVCDKHSLKSLQWYTRFPYMIGQRYTYNDTDSNALKDNYKLHEFGPLSELPLDLKWPNI